MGVRERGWTLSSALASVPTPACPAPHRTRSQLCQPQPFACLTMFGGIPLTGHLHGTQKDAGPCSPCPPAAPMQMYPIHRRQRCLLTGCSSVRRAEVPCLPSAYVRCQVQGSSTVALGLLGRGIHATQCSQPQHPLFARADPEQRLQFAYSPLLPCRCLGLSAPLGPQCRAAACRAGVGWAVSLSLKALCLALPGHSTICAALRAAPSFLALARREDIPQEGKCHESASTFLVLCGQRKLEQAPRCKAPGASSASGKGTHALAHFFPPLPSPPSKSVNQLCLAQKRLLFRHCKNTLCTLNRTLECKAARQALPQQY